MAVQSLRHCATDQRRGVQFRCQWYRFEDTGHRDELVAHPDLCSGSDNAEALGCTRPQNGCRILRERFVEPRSMRHFACHHVQQCQISGDGRDPTCFFCRNQRAAIDLDVGQGSCAGCIGNTRQERHFRCSVWWQCGSGSRHVASGSDCQQICAEGVQLSSQLSSAGGGNSDHRHHCCDPDRDAQC